jgi:hypothetical protein
VADPEALDLWTFAWDKLLLHVHVQAANSKSHQHTVIERHWNNAHSVHDFMNRIDRGESRTQYKGKVFDAYITFHHPQLRILNRRKQSLLLHFCGFGFIIRFILLKTTKISPFRYTPSRWNIKH